MKRTYADRPHMRGVAWNAHLATVRLDDGSVQVFPIRDFDRGLYNASDRRRLTLVLPPSLGGVTEFHEAGMGVDEFRNGEGEWVTLLSVHYV